jgi:hypothetical protein
VRLLARSFAFFDSVWQAVIPLVPTERSQKDFREPLDFTTCEQ